MVIFHSYVSLPEGNNHLLYTTTQGFPWLTAWMDPLHSWSHPALRMTWRAVWDIRPVTGRGISPTFMASPVTLRPVQGGRNWVSRWYPWSDFEMLRRLLQHILHDLSSTKRVSWHIVFFFLIFFMLRGKHFVTHKGHHREMNALL